MIKKGEFGNQIEFTFSKDSEWQEAIYSIFLDPHEFIDHAVITDGRIDFPHTYFNGTMPFIIKAKGYKDAQITVEIPFAGIEF